MEVGGEYRLGDIGSKHWRRFAEENRLDFDQMRERITDMAARLPDLASAVRDQIAADGAPHPLNDKLFSVFTERAQWALEDLAKPLER